MLDIGEPAPEFELADQEGRPVRSPTSTECTMWSSFSTEGQHTGLQPGGVRLRDAYGDLLEKEAVVLGVSSDRRFAQGLR
jgi:peroxiredoxin